MPEQDEDLNISNLLQAQRELLLGPAQSGQAPGPAAGGPAGGEADEDAFVNIKHYAFLVYGRKWWVLLVTAVVFVAAGAYSYLRPKVYEARAEVVLNESLISSDSLFNRRAVYYDPEALAKLAEKEQVVKIADGKVIEELKRVRDDPDIKLKPRERVELEAAIAEPVGVGQIIPPRVGKYTVTLTGRHQGAESKVIAKMLARTKAKALALALIEYFQAAVGGGRRIKDLKTLIKSNDEQLKSISQQLATALVPEGSLPPGVLSMLDFIQRQKRERMRTQVTITEVNQRIAEIEKLMGKSGEARVNVSPELQAKLLRLHTERAQMEERYKEDHPKLKRKKAEISALERFMTERKFDTTMSTSRGHGTLRNEFDRAVIEKRSLEAREKALSENIARASERLAGKGASEAALEYERLVREHRSLEGMSDDLRRKLREAELTAMTGKGQSDKRIIELNKVTGAVPTGATTAQTVGFAVVLGLVMGVLLALLLEHLDDTVRSEVSARRATNLPVIARLPRFEGSDQKRFISSSAPRSDVAETFKFFHNHVRYTGPNAPEKCLQITSPGPEEGKSYVAVNLALSFASEGNRVCFVDADLRRSRTHERVNALRPSGSMDDGLCGYLEGRLAYEDVLLASENENLSLILAGGRATNPPRLLRSERMHELIERLQAEYDVVIVDAPPVLPVVDAAILSSLARATLLVVRFAHTHQGDLAEAASRLAHVNAPLVGVVVNGVHGSGAGYYYGGYRYRYRYRYGTGYGYGGYGG